MLKKLLGKLTGARRNAAIFAAAAVAALLVFPVANAAVNDGAKFRREYESLNGQTAPDGEHTYKTVAVPKNIQFKYVDAEGAKKLLSSGSGVLYMGFPECPWCRTLLPALTDAYRESGHKGQIYYYNGLADRDVKSLSENGDIVTEEEGLPAYRDLVAALYGFLSPYKGLEDDSIKRIYFPTTVFFKNGSVTSAHLTTVPTQESGYDALSDAEYQTLKNELIEKFNAIK